MIEFMTIFFSRIPVWVLPVFAILFFIGYRSLHERRVPLIVYYCFPILTVIPALQLLQNDPVLPALMAFAAGIAVGGVVGFYLQGRWIIELERNTILVRGEWVTLLALMLIFWANFANGVIGGVNPELASDAMVVFLIGFLKSLAAASFLGRSIRVLAAKNEPK